MQVHLLRRMIYPVENPARGLIIECQSGICWLTQKYDAEDHILKPGERFVVCHKGHIVVEGIRDGWVRIVEKEEELAA